MEDPDGSIKDPTALLKDPGAIQQKPRRDRVFVRNQGIFVSRKGRSEAEDAPLVAPCRSKNASLFPYPLVQ